MTKPIAIVDTNFLNHLVIASTNVGSLQPIAEFLVRYDVRIPETVRSEFTTGVSGSDARRYLLGLIEGDGTHSVISTVPSPVTTSLLSDGAVTSNGGEFAAIEAYNNLSKTNSGVVVFSDDKFFYEGRTPLSYIENRNTDSFRNIANFDEVFGFPLNPPQASVGFFNTMYDEGLIGADKYKIATESYRGSLSPLISVNSYTNAEVGLPENFDWRTASRDYRAASLASELWRRADLLVLATAAPALYFLLSRKANAEGISEYQAFVNLGGSITEEQFHQFVGGAAAELVVSAALGPVGLAKKAFDLLLTHLIQPRWDLRWRM